LYSSSGTKLLNASTAKVVSGSVPIDYDLAVWDSKDRVIAISMGYLLATIMGYLYLRITGFLAGPNRGQRIEGVVAEVLLQAGGVMKVILIIGIEMIVFPLYCGTLLDIALLPLFSEATIISRIAFTTGSPLTSLFVHWFIGTCYMFHFALFVSMCRKILRTGVLCKFHLSIVAEFFNTDFSFQQTSSETLMTLHSTPFEMSWNVALLPSFVKLALVPLFMGH
jgi:E3 ubiquitin-protein ligase MARCH6